MTSDPPPFARSQPLTLFLSYSRADRAIAEQLASRLERAGHIVWWDALIEGGAKFASSIRNALDSADVVIVLWSQSAVESDWVRDKAAQGRDRRRLVPLSIDGSKPPLGFRQYQVIDIARWTGKADAPEVTAILRAIAITAGQTVGPAQPQPLRTQTEPRASRRQILVGAGAGTLAASGAGLAAWRHWRGAGFVPAAQTIAVLPFKNLSGNPDQDYLAAGLTDELRATQRSPCVRKCQDRAKETDHDEHERTPA